MKEETAGRFEKLIGLSKARLNELRKFINRIAERLRARALRVVAVSFVPHPVAIFIIARHFQFSPRLHPTRFEGWIDVYQIK